MPKVVLLAGATANGQAADTITRFTGGSLKIRTGASPGAANAATGTLVVTLPVVGTPTVANGVITIAFTPAVIATNVAITGGTDVYGRYETSGGVTVMDVNCGPNGTDYAVNVGTAMPIGQQCSVTSATHTLPLVTG